MKFIRKLLIALLTIALVVLAYCLVIITALGSSAKINQLIRDAGIYKLTTQYFSQQTDKLANLPPGVDKAKLTQSINRAIDESDVEKIVEPILVDVVDWLNAPKNNQLPTLVIDLGRLKNKLATTIKADFEQPTADQIIFGLTGQISDQIVISPSQFAASAPVKQSQAEQLKSSYLLAKQSLWAAGLGVVGLLLILILIHSRQGRRMLQKPAWAFFNAGITVLTLSLLLPYFLPQSIASELNPENISLSLARSILLESRFWGFVWLVGCAILVTASLFLKKPDQKRH